MADCLTVYVRLLSRCVPFSDLYHKRFPELEQLATQPMDYVRVVQRIQNNSDLSGVKLTDVLPAASVMAVTVSFAGSTGVKLEDDVMSKVLEACEVAVALDNTRTTVCPRTGLLVCVSLSARIADREAEGGGGGVWEVFDVCVCVCSY